MANRQSSCVVAGIRVTPCVMPTGALQFTAMPTAAVAAAAAVYDVAVSRMPPVKSRYLFKHTVNDCVSLEGVYETLRAASAV